MQYLARNGWGSGERRRFAVYVPVSLPRCGMRIAAEGGGLHICTSCDRDVGRRQTRPDLIDQRKASSKKATSEKAKSGHLREHGVASVLKVLSTRRTAGSSGSVREHYLDPVIRGLNEMAHVERLEPSEFVPATA